MTSNNQAKLNALQGAAPAISPDFFPFSNDDMYDSLVTALVRTDTAEYQQAQLPVALLVGEAALAASLSHGLLPEPGIICLDNQSQAVQHMSAYTSTLRAVDTATMWREIMEIDGEPSALSKEDQERYQRRLHSQITLWQGRGLAHPFGAQSEPYNAAHDAIRQKKTIPWLADIARPEDMAYLGEQLRNVGATVTLLYLSNAIPYSSLWHGAPGFPTAAGYAGVLSQLPVTPNVPIITTSITTSGPSKIAVATGPFWGLDDLAARGGNSQCGRVALPPGATRRQPLCD
jgi:hypothetical protein